LNGNRRRRFLEDQQVGVNRRQFGLVNAWDCGNGRDSGGEAGRNKASIGGNLRRGWRRAGSKR
jgi:hypothetical protein